jgi:hypothetical protein
MLRRPPPGVPHAPTAMPFQQCAVVAAGNREGAVSLCELVGGASAGRHGGRAPTVGGRWQTRREVLRLCELVVKTWLRRGTSKERARAARKGSGHVCTTVVRGMMALPTVGGRGGKEGGRSGLVVYWR